MSTDRHSEIEFKWKADHVNETAFLQWAMSQKPVRYEASSCPDVYYTHGDNAVRHRWSGGAGELTVKQRKSAKNITDRVEVDLKFPAAITVGDVTKFLTASGWKRLFTLYKDAVHVFWYEKDDASITLSMYGVKKFNERTRRCGETSYFIEVEVEKGSHLSDTAARVVLDQWGRDLEVSFNLGVPLNVSLYEMYSNRTYTTASKDKANGSSRNGKGRRNRNGRAR